MNAPKSLLLEDEKTEKEEMSLMAFVRILWKTGSFWLVPFLALNMIGMMMLVPLLPTLMSNYFASEMEGTLMRCEDFEPPRPPSCQNAHAVAVSWSSMSSFVSHTMLSFLISPFIGALSDRMGRKPFLLMNHALALLPTIVVFLYVRGLIKLRWYYLAHAMSAGFDGMSIASAYMADTMPAHFRAPAIGLLMGSISFGLLLGPLVDGVLREDHYLATTLALGIQCTNLGIGTLCMPESLPRHAKLAAKDAVQLNPEVTTMAEAGGALRCAMQTEPPSLGTRFVAGLKLFVGSLRISWGIITRNSLFKRLAICTMDTGSSADSALLPLLTGPAYRLVQISGVCIEGFRDILFQYLQ
eukprot:gene8115-9642_t